MLVGIYVKPHNHETHRCPCQRAHNTNMFAFLLDRRTASWAWHDMTSPVPIKRCMEHAWFFYNQSANTILKKRKHHDLSVVLEPDSNYSWPMEWGTWVDSIWGERNLDDGPPRSRSSTRFSPIITASPGMTTTTYTFFVPRTPSPVANTWNNQAVSDEEDPFALSPEI